METTNNDQGPSSPAPPQQPQTKRTSIMNRPLPLLPAHKSPQTSPAHSPRDSSTPLSPKPMEPQLSPTKNGGQPKTPRKRSNRHVEDEFIKNKSVSGVDFSDFEPIENIISLSDDISSSQTETSTNDNQEAKENNNSLNEPSKNKEESQNVENEENNSKENQKDSQEMLKKSGENLINSDDQINSEQEKNEQIEQKIENSQIEKKKNEERTPTTKRRSSMHKEERLKLKKEKSKEKSEEKSEEASDISENKSGEEKRKKKKKKKHHGSQTEELKGDESEKSDSGSGSSSNPGSEIKASKPEENFSRRHKIVNEIVSTEKSYIESLEKLIKLFGPLIDAKFDQNDFPVSEMNSLQSNAGIILGYSGVFLQMINKAVADFNENETTIGPIFLNLADYMRGSFSLLPSTFSFFLSFFFCWVGGSIEFT